MVKFFSKWSQVLAHPQTQSLLYSRRKILVIGLLSFPSVVLADLYDDYINSVSKKPFVSFLARKGSTSSLGHAFVGVGVELDAGLLLFEKFFGLYPKDGALAGVKSSFGPQSGKIDRTWDDIAWDTELRRFIDEERKASVLQKFQEWNASPPQYSLIGNGGINCNGLVSAVAEAIELTVPSGAATTRPWKFIESLKEHNP